MTRASRLFRWCAVAALVAGCSIETPRADTTATNSTPVPSPSESPSSTPAPTPTTPAPAPTTAPPPGTAAEQLAALPVKGRAPKVGYDRSHFGPAWTDVDRNGCDTRNDILTRDLVAETYRPGTHDCVVISGTLADPYTGSVIAFAKERASEVQIDHVVALGDAWQSGAQQLTPDQRERLANDPLNLLAVSGAANQAKSDSNAASWLPPNTAFRCDYVARQIAVKTAYLLWVTPAERDSMASVLASCPGAPAAGAST